MALIRASEALDKLKLTGDEASGVDILKRAIDSPLKQIAENAGHHGEVVLQHVKEGKGNFGFDAAGEGEYVDMVKAGIIDPTKVVRFALQNAASVAALLLTTDALVSEIKEKKDRPMPGGPPGGGEYDEEMY